MTNFDDFTKAANTLALLEQPRNGIPELTHFDIAAAISRLAAGAGAFAVDTERAGGFRYSNRAYLIQIKRENGEIFLIDPVGIESELAPLADLMRGEWILHDAAQDLPCLRELGLVPEKIFDTEIATLILGFQRHSLQAIVADLLGIALAKEHAAADWSIRPISTEMRAYAALDVELLHELRAVLTQMLEETGRSEWFAQECEHIRLSEPKPAKVQPWRKCANRIELTDRRSLAMLENMWWEREKIAQMQDVPPSKIVSSAVLAEVARRKPRSKADLVRSPLFRKNSLRAYTDVFWTAIHTAWSTAQTDLPDRFQPKMPSAYPPLKSWETHDPAAFIRWNVLREAVINHAAKLGIRQDVLLKPKLQKQIAWEGWKSAADFSAKLAGWGARPWQIEQCTPVIMRACS